jgi:hypothetical protein
MSTNNSAAAIGFDQAVTPKRTPSIGQYVQDLGATPAGTADPGPTADGPYFGIVGNTSWNYNWLGEAVGFTAPSNAGLTGTTNVPAVGVTPPDVGTPSGKKAIWATNTANLTVPADGRLAVTVGGVATAASGTGAYKTFLPAGTVLTFTAAVGNTPAIQQYFWAFEV